MKIVVEQKLIRINVVNAEVSANRILSSLATAKGQLLAASSANTWTVLEPSTNGKVLALDSTTANGVKWADTTSPVTSVNAKTGVVVLTPSDVGAVNATDIVSQAEAETGSATTVRAWTAQRVKEAIVALHPANAVTSVNSKTGAVTITYTDVGSLSSSDLPTQAEAEAGTATSARVWTAERVKQAILALAPAGSSAVTSVNTKTGAVTITYTDVGALSATDIPTQVEAEAGTATTARVWTAERVKQAIVALAPASAVTSVAGRTGAVTVTYTDVGSLSSTDIPTQAESEAGTATTARVWTAERVKQAITALQTVHKTTTTATSTASLTVNASTTHTATLSALAEAVTINAPSSPADADKLIIRIKDNGTSRAITWNAVFDTPIGVTLPTATSISKWHYLGFVYHAATTKWHAVAVGVQS